MNRWNGLTKEATALRRLAGLYYEEGNYRLSPRVIRALRRAIPLDTRDLTARILGDPLPGRSALDMRSASRTPHPSAAPTPSPTGGED